MKRWELDGETHVTWIELSLFGSQPPRYCRTYLLHSLSIVWFTLATGRPWFCFYLADMLSVLPAETLLEIIGCLPFTTIASLSILSKPWAAFMTTNESSIYRNISKRYGYASDGGSCTIAPSEGWKSWCELTHREFFVRFPTMILQSSRNSRQNSGGLGNSLGTHTKSGSPKKNRNFDHIKVDEEAGFVISTLLTGGLVVSDIHDHGMLWSLEAVFRVPDLPHTL
jgi:hypothetical protein